MAHATTEKDGTTHVFGYVKLKDGKRTLTDWYGKKTILDCRSHRVDTYLNDGWSISECLVFMLAKGRFVVGYSLGDGCLFRGEYFTPQYHGTPLDDAEYHAREVCRCWIEKDQEDDNEFLMRQG